MESFLTSGIPTVTPNPPAGEKRRFFSPISSTLTLRQAGCGTRRHLHDRRPERRPRRSGEGQREEPDDDLHHARPPRPSGARSPHRNLAHGIEADVPAVWAGSEQPNRHAVGMPSLLNGLFIGQIRALLLGSGPRGRRFKSSRPDQFLRRPAESRLPGPSVPLANSPRGTEWWALQIQASCRIVRDFSPASLANRSIPRAFPGKELPSTLPDIGADTERLIA